MTNVEIHTAALQMVHPAGVGGRRYVWINTISSLPILVLAGLQQKSTLRRLNNA
jgi:hypothetical protein